MIGSVLVPIKALLLNMLSLTAHVRRAGLGLPGRPPGGRPALHADRAIDMFTPILMFCVAFGLSMDYEVFLMSRIKEEYDHDQRQRTRGGRRAGAHGPHRHRGRCCCRVVFVAFATSEVSIIKLIGLGLALAVLVDALIIRATLVPAFMRLAGRRELVGASTAPPPSPPLRRVGIRTVGHPRPGGRGTCNDPAVTPSAISLRGRLSRRPSLLTAAALGLPEAMSQATQQLVAHVGQLLEQNGEHVGAEHTQGDRDSSPRAIAVRGPGSSSASSPKEEPGPRVPTVRLPRREGFTSPSSRM